MNTGATNPTYEKLAQRLRAQPKTWLVTGVAGFIGSHLLESLLQFGQQVVGVDNFATGHRRNLEEVRAVVGDTVWWRFRFSEGDIANLETCRSACKGVDYVLHQAGLGSVPRSIEDPVATHRANVDGFLNMLLAARDRGVARFVYATSSSVYGEHPALPRIEEAIGDLLSPYAVTKYVNELYARVFARLYGLHSIGLRYFNVFGPRQDPDGAYAAVIPKWIGLLLNNVPCPLYGDGANSRDFCYVANAVQANLLAATVEEEAALDQVYNIAFGQQTTLNELHAMIRDRLAHIRPGLRSLQPVSCPPRRGDIRHSWADIRKAARLLGYAPTHSVEQGLDAALEWYVSHLAEPTAA
ncbi:MAG: SDR family oxidoreductase [candidate division NC10 bacterium]|nr:SDR family oxidoreductase [candidate division NC10 bacterium]